MVLGTIQILALIFIVIAIVKIIVMLIEPKALLKVSDMFYEKQQVFMVLLSALLAYVVLWYLLGAGVTIVEIFAIGLFFSLLMSMSLSVLYKDIAKDAKKWLANKKRLLRQQWFQILIWAVLLIWGLLSVFA